MLTFEQKVSIFSSFPQLKRNDMTQDRVNFEYTMSRRRGYVLAHELHKKGNGYICGKYLDSTDNYKIQKDGWISIKNCDEEELRTLIKKVIHSMSV
jgi:hypothetical protein